MSETVQANDGAQLPISSLPQSFEYDGNFVSSITVFYQGNYYVQTFTNDGTNITEISGYENTYPPTATLIVSETGNMLVAEHSDPRFPTYLVTE